MTSRDHGIVECKLKVKTWFKSAKTWQTLSALGSLSLKFPVQYYIYSTGLLRLSWKYQASNSQDDIRDKYYSTFPNNIMSQKEKNTYNGNFNIFTKITSSEPSFFHI